jgi:hypothetical protein
LKRDTLLFSHLKVLVAYDCVLTALNRILHNVTSVKKGQWAFIITSTFSPLFVIGTLARLGFIRLHQEPKKCISQVNINLKAKAS